MCPFAMLADFMPGIQHGAQLREGTWETHALDKLK